MSKYIVDIDDFEPHFKVDSIGVFGIGKSLSYSEEDHSWSRIKFIEEFEELNSDYINEHFSSLQDEAYQRGLEDGKKHLANGCVGCQYEGDEGRVNPCCECARVCDDHYIPKTSDRIEVGDEVNWDGDCFIVTKIFQPRNMKEQCDGIDDDGSVYQDILMEDLKKTGKHYDIQSILEAMRT
jgi:hypothetical protein